MSSPQRTTPPAAEAARILDTIRSFVSACRRPVLVEPGEPPVPLTPSTAAFELRGGSLTVQAWDARRSITRRVVGVAACGPGLLDLAVERFGGRRGRLRILDEDRPAGHPRLKQAERQVFRERFRRFLHRQFPGWRLTALSTEPDLEHTLSPSYPRAAIAKGHTAWAAIAVPPESGDAAAGLTFGLIWLDYLRRRAAGRPFEGLILLLPEGRQHTTCLRLRHLDPRVARFMVFVVSEDGAVERIEPGDFGNLETRLESNRVPPGGSSLAAGVEELAALPGVQAVTSRDGLTSLRFRGLEFARLERGSLLVGLDRTEAVPASGPAAVRALIDGLARMRSPDAADRGNPLFRRAPEAWLEAQVRSNLAVISAGLRPDPVYGQVPSFSGGERGIVDLLASDAAGRLAVIELKATADPHLPLQALDYWLRVRHHALSGEFPARGYFPGVPVSRQPPRLLLVAPALEFHPTSESVLRFFSPEIDVERVGVGRDWRRRITISFRARGAEPPGLPAPVTG